MRRLLVPVILAACHHGGAHTPAPAQPTTVAIVEDSVGLVMLDGRVLPRSTFLATTNTLQLGPYLFDGMSGFDLRDPSAAMMGLDLPVDSGHIGEGAYGEVIAVVADGGLDVSIEGEHHLVPWPGDQPSGFALSPDGTTAAFAAGDLYTLDTRAAAFVDLGRPKDDLDVGFVDDHTLIVSRDVTDVDFTLRSLTGAPDRDLTLADGWTTIALEDLPVTAPRVPVLREEKGQRGLYDLSTGDVLAYPYGDRVLAVSPDGGAAVTTTPCQVTGGLTRITAAGAEVLRANPPDDPCHDMQDFPAPPVSAVYTSDGKLITAMPGGAGWQVKVDGQIVRESANPMRVFAYDARRQSTK